LTGARFDERQIYKNAMEIIDLPRARLAVTQFRPTIMSCAASLAKKMIPLSSLAKSQFDSPEPGERGYQYTIFPFLFDLADYQELISFRLDQR